MTYVCVAMHTVDEPKMKLVEVKRIFHRGAFRLGMFFPIDGELKARAKMINATWSQTHKCWYVDDGNTQLKEILKTFKGIAWVNYKEINSKLSADDLKTFKQGYHNQKKGKARVQSILVKTQEPYKIKAPKEYRELLIRRRYSDNTVKTYVSMFTIFLNEIGAENPQNVTEEEIKAYMNRLVKEKRVSQSTHNQMINAIKFYYEHVLGLEKKKYWIDRPRKESRLPKVTSEENIVKLIAAANNLKHQCVIGLIYSAGLRRSELVNLRISDVDMERRQVFVRGGKGKKDRYTMLSERLILGLQKYLNEYKPNYWFFEGKNRSKYADSTIGQIVKQAAERANVGKITPHMLRHSFATHLMDHGTDIRIIQEFLGHESIKTTELYTHVTNRNLQKIVNPLDKIFSSKSDEKRHLENGGDKK